MRRREEWAPQQEGNRLRGSRRGRSHKKKPPKQTLKAQEEVAAAVEVWRTQTSCPAFGDLPGPVNNLSNEEDSSSPQRSTSSPADTNGPTDGELAPYFLADEGQPIKQEVPGEPGPSPPPSNLPRFDLPSPPKHQVLDEMRC